MPLTDRALPALLAALTAATVLGGCRGQAPAAVVSEDPGETGAPAVSGLANVIDGDSLEVDGVSIRLFGVDAFESAQYCYRANGTRWRCGHWASVELDRLAGGKQIECSPVEKDSYGRVVARCRRGSTDLARHLVAGGWGLAYRKYSEDYVADEEAARGGSRGVWGSKFEAPWDWRRRIRGG